jgi:hypothetical protein
MSALFYFVVRDVLTRTILSASSGSTKITLVSSVGLKAPEADFPLLESRATLLVASRMARS